MNSNGGNVVGEEKKKDDLKRPSKICLLLLSIIIGLLEL